MRRLIHGLAVLVAIASCAAPERARMEVGSFVVSAEIPEGWRHLDLGRRHLVQQGENQVVFEDFGPVTPEGIRREVVRARELARAGRLATAKSVLSMIPLPEDLFASPGQRRSFVDTWSEVAQAPEGTPTGSVDAAFERLLAAVGTLHARDSAAVERAILREMGADSRRDVAVRKPVRAGGRDGVMLVTWQRTTHETRGRHAIFIADGSALGLWTGLGSLGATGPVFDRVLKSLEFETAAPDSVTLNGSKPAS